jgi:hypothetical protein
MDDQEFHKSVQRVSRKMQSAVEGKMIRTGMAACSTVFASLCDSLTDAETEEAIKMFGEAVVAVRANVKGAKPQ